MIFFNMKKIAQECWIVHSITRSCVLREKPFAPSSTAHIKNKRNQILVTQLKQIVLNRTELILIASNDSVFFFVGFNSGVGFSFLIFFSHPIMHHVCVHMLTNKTTQHHYVSFNLCSLTHALKYLS